MRKFVLAFLIVITLVVGGFVVYFSIQKTTQPSFTDLSSNAAISSENSAPTSSKEDQDNTGISYDEQPASAQNAGYPQYSEIAIPGDPLPSIPYGNGRGVVILSDALLTLHATGGQLIATRHSGSDGALTQEAVIIDTTSSTASGALSAGSLTNSDDTALGVWIGSKGIQASFSSDGGKSWGSHVALASRPVGPATPTSCVWKDQQGELNALVAWVAPPQKSDGGPVYMSRFAVGKWSETYRVGQLELASSPSLACDSTEQSMVMRNGQTNDLRLYFTKSSDGGISWGEPKEVLRGADPNLAHCGDDYWIAYHWAGTKVAHSTDGGETWSVFTHDASGKFEAVACDGDLVAVTWGDYESQQAAQQKTSPRKVGAAISTDAGANWFRWYPQGEDDHQSTGSLDVDNGLVALFGRVPNVGVWVATWSQ